MRLFAENEASHVPVYSTVVSFETSGAPSVVTFASHAVHDGLIRVLGDVEPHGYDTHYHFDYVLRNSLN